MPRLTSAVLAMSQDEVNAEVPTGLNWNEHSAGIGGDDDRRGGDRLLEAGLA